MPSKDTPEQRAFMWGLLKYNESRSNLIKSHGLVRLIAGSAYEAGFLAAQEYYTHTLPTMRENQDDITLLRNHHRLGLLSTNRPYPE